MKKYKYNTADVTLAGMRQKYYNWCTDETLAAAYGVYQELFGEHWFMSTRNLEKAAAEACGESFVYPTNKYVEVAARFAGGVELFCHRLEVPHKKESNEEGEKAFFVHDTRYGEVFETWLPEHLQRWREGKYVNANGLVRLVDVEEQLKQVQAVLTKKKAVYGRGFELTTSEHLDRTYAPIHCLVWLGYTGRLTMQRLQLDRCLVTGEPLAYGASVGLVLKERSLAGYRFDEESYSLEYSDGSTKVFKKSSYTTILLPYVYEHKASIPVGKAFAYTLLADKLAGVRFAHLDELDIDAKKVNQLMKDAVRSFNKHTP